ncbi:MAG: IS5/IS1182 family transposase [Rhodocyclaceae bacterium]|nr:IS5/IS1182 family transposase [Rhodocyclaceae bacterium]
MGGRPTKDDRLVLSGIVYLLRTGLPWRDVPAHFGVWGTIYTRFRRWCATGLFARMLSVLSRRGRGALRHLDCSHIKLHQHGTNPAGGQLAQAMGRTKGGLNTKLAAIVDRHGRALAVALAPGPRHDLLAVEPVLARARRGLVVADKGFDADNFRRRLRAQRTRCCIPPKRARRQPARFHRGHYRHRHHVENFFGRIKAMRRISTRYEKLATTFLAFVQLAAVIDWLIHRV